MPLLPEILYRKEIRMSLKIVIYVLVKGTHIIYVRISYIVSIHPMLWLRRTTISNPYIVKKHNVNNEVSLLAVSTLAPCGFFSISALI
jgi:hypothetical protein